MTIDDHHGYHTIAKTTVDFQHKVLRSFEWQIQFIRTMPTNHIYQEQPNARIFSQVAKTYTMEFVQRLIFVIFFVVEFFVTMNISSLQRKLTIGFVFDVLLIFGVARN